MGVDDRYLLKLGGTYSGEAADIWDALNWPNDPNGDGGLFEEDTDTAHLPGGVTGDLTLSANMACQRMNASGWRGTLIMAANDLDVIGSLLMEGDITGTGNISVSETLAFFAATDLSGWSGALTLDGTAGSWSMLAKGDDGVEIPALVVNNNGVAAFTLADNMVVGALTYTAGKFTTIGRIITIMAGTHIVSWNTAGHPLTHLNIPTGSKITQGSTIQVREITWGAGVGGVCMTGTASKDLRCLFATNDPWHQTVASGAVSPDHLRIKTTAADVEIGYLDASAIGGTFWLTGGDSFTVKMTGAWTVAGKNFNLAGGLNNKTQTLDTNDQNLNGGTLQLGHKTSVTRSGVVLLRSGTHVFATIAAEHVDNPANALNFGTGQTTFSQNVDLAHVAVTSDSAVLLGAVELKNCNCVGLLYAPNASDGGGNSADVIFGWPGGTRLKWGLFGPWPWTRRP